MSVKKAANGEWISSLTGFSYSSLEAAQFYDDRQKQEARVQTKGEKILENLSAEEIKSLYLAVTSRADEDEVKAQGAAQSEEWFQAHPEIISAPGEVGYANGVRMDLWLRQQGRSYPYSSQDLDQAYEALAETGVLTMDPTVKPKATVVDKYVNPLDAWRDTQRRA
jgi:hypothetical protein